MRRPTKAKKPKADPLYPARPRNYGIGNAVQVSHRVPSAPVLAPCRRRRSLGSSCCRRAHCVAQRCACARLPCAGGGSRGVSELCAALRLPAGA